MSRTTTRAVDATATDIATAVAVSTPSVTDETRNTDASVVTWFDGRYEKIRTLGKGNFGKVYLAKDGNTGEEVAIKVIDKTSFSSSDQHQRVNNERAICERFIGRLKHKNIVRVHWVASDNECVHMAMEYIAGGELFEKIKKHRRLEEPLARRWFREIIEAVNYIHQNGIVHRDLKPENVLIDRHQHIRICDFGFGKFCERQQILNTYCGSPFYAAPEMVTATPYRGPPVDMWSCGVILYSMLAGMLPFQGEDMPHLFRQIDRASFSIPGYISKEAADLIHQLLSKNPNHRITADACLKHPWLNNRPLPSAAAATSYKLHPAASTVLKSVDTNSEAFSSSKTTTKKFVSLLPYATVPQKQHQSNKNKSISKTLRILTKLVFIHKETQVAPQQSGQGGENISSGASPKSKTRQEVVHHVKGFLKTTFQRHIAQDNSPMQKE